MARILIVGIGALLLSGCMPNGDTDRLDREAKSAAIEAQKLAESQARVAAQRAEQERIRAVNEANAQRQIDDAKAKFLAQYPYFPFAYSVDIWHQAFGSVNIVGTVTNVSQYRIKFARIVFDILDLDGNKVGTAFDTIDGLNPGESWKFEADYRNYGESVGGSRYRLSTIDGY